MSETLVIPRPLTVAEYLDAEEAGQVRHEYIDGAVYAMAGGSDRHNLLAGAIYARLSGGIPIGCQAFVVDMKLRIKTAQSTIFYYPDVMVTCSPDDRASHWREKPSVLVEVLSPKTERVDRTEKLAAYTQIPSLETYLLVAQDVPRIEAYRRADGWQRRELLSSHKVMIDPFGIELAVEDLYRRAGFEA